MDDLYPDPAWNFVFGQASPHDRVGVCSFARYLPGEAGAAAGLLLLRRSCKVLAHETAHLLGIAHCVFYSCLMNGSSHLAESDVRPLHPCPVDLRKLQDSIRFDVVARYQRLRTVAGDVGFTGDARWLTGQLLHIDQGQAQPDPRPPVTTGPASERLPTKLDEVRSRRAQARHSTSSAVPIVPGDAALSWRLTSHPGSAWMTSEAGLGSPAIGSGNGPAVWCRGSACALPGAGGRHRRIRHPR
jgi:Peptidase family M54